MISSLLKSVMRERRLTQSALAAVMGVGLDRVKSLTSGKVHKLTREEGEALIRKLHVRGDWLATGEGPMFQSEGEQAFTQRLGALGSSAQVAADLGLSASQARLMTELLYYTETGNKEGVREALARFTELSRKEAALVDNYRHLPSETQDVLMRTSAAFAQSAPPEERVDVVAQSGKKTAGRKGAR